MNIIIAMALALTASSCASDARESDAIKSASHEDNVSRSN